MNTLLIVEDDPMLGTSLMHGFREQGFEVMTAGTLAAARGHMGRGGFQLVILDLGLADGDGFELIRELAALPKPPPVLITTARGDLDERLRGLEGGAEDYLVKPYAFAELLARVRVLLRRVRPHADTTLRVGDLELDSLARRATRGGTPIELTPREFELLAHLALAGGAVVTREMLARDVWRQRAWTASMDNVIDVHVSRLREKVDGGATVKLLHTVRGGGFFLKEGA